MSTPTIETVARVPDPVLRNLWITQTYHELGLAMADRGLGPDASWPLYAVWASKSAGRIIRGEELPAAVRASVGANPAVAAARQRVNLDWRMGEVSVHFEDDHLFQMVDRIAAAVSGQLATGNLIVFQELAPAFRSLSAGQTPEPVPGLEPAFALYEKALCEPDEKSRAVLVLTANVLAVTHEQRRLDGYIGAAIDAPIDEGIQEVLDQVADHLPGHWLRSRAQAAFDDLCGELRRVWEEAATSALMTLQTADERLDLHETLPPPPDGGPLFGDLLAGSDAVAAVREWDPTEGRGAYCGAQDWRLIQQRMGYIVNLFRSRQRHPTLAAPPFGDAQLDALGQGILPAGPL